MIERGEGILLQYHKVCIHLLLTFDPMIPCWTTQHRGFHCAFYSFNRLSSYLSSLTLFHIEIICSLCLSFPDQHLQYLYLQVYYEYMHLDNDSSIPHLAAGHVNRDAN